jgi:hypothetical protein
MLKIENSSLDVFKNTHLFYYGDGLWKVNIQLKWSSGDEIEAERAPGAT